jgi:hypothetical protein
VLGDNRPAAMRAAFEALVREREPA